MIVLYLIVGFLLYCGAIAAIAFVLRDQLHRLAVVGDVTHQALVFYAIYNVAIVILTFLALLLNHAFSLS